MKTIGLLLIACAVANAAGGDRVIELESRPGVKVAYLLAMDEGVKYHAAAILFSGSGGDIHLHPEAEKKTSNKNFLIRSRRFFVETGIAVAAIDSPPDMKGMTSLFRKSDRHVTDILAVLDDLKRRVPGAKVYLIGTSQGSVSAAYAASKLQGKIAGAVLTSSTFANGGEYGAGLNGFDFDSIKVPILLVHHRDDGCPSSPYYKASKLGKRFPLITVIGGDSPRSADCEPLAAHGYLGKEKETVAAIADWIFGRPYPSEVR